MNVVRLREVLKYSKRTGLFTWIKPTHPQSRRCVIGANAGHASTSGHLQICIDGKFHSSHRLAWLYVTGSWPDGDIDHRNGIPSDNRWSNLRLASRSQNVANAKKRAGSKSTLKGVKYHAQSNKWVGQLRVAGRALYLGIFKTPEKAHAAYVKAAREHFGEFARVR